MVDEDENKEQPETTHSDPDTNNSHQVSNGLDTVSNGLDTVSDGLDTVSDGLDTVSDGLDTVSNNTETDTNHSETVSKGLDTVSKGLNPVSKGLNPVSKGLDPVLEPDTKELNKQREQKKDKLYQLFKRFICSASNTPELKEELVKIIEKPQCCEDCFYCKKADKTTQEPKYAVSPHISEFWATATSPFYHLVFFTLFIPISQWWLGWRKNDGYPKQLLITIYLCIALGIFSTIYHATLREYVGCLDCGFSIIAWCGLLLSVFGFRIEIYLTAMFIIIGVFIIFLPNSPSIAVITGAILLPLTFYVCIKAGTMFSYLSGICIGLGSICFFADRTKLVNFPYLHSLWHILGGACQLFSALHILIHGPIHNVSAYLPFTDASPPSISPITPITPMPITRGSIPYLSDFSDVIA